MDTVLVLDFGAQYGHLIARCIRECHVFCEVIPHDASVDDIRARNPKAIVLTGGPASVYAPDAPQCDPGLFDLGVPVMGICYGIQIMAFQLGGEVTPTERKEFGRAEIHVTVRLFARPKSMVASSRGVHTAGPSSSRAAWSTTGRTTLTSPCRLDPTTCRRVARPM